MGQQRSGPSIEIRQPPYVPASVSDGTEIKRFRFGDPRKGKPEVGYPTKIKLPFSGYDIQLFCGDFINFKFLYLFLI